jgi:hypothetical protein
MRRGGASKGDIRKGRRGRRGKEVNSIITRLEIRKRKIK